MVEKVRIAAMGMAKLAILMSMENIRCLILKKHSQPLMEFNRNCVLLISRVNTQIRKWTCALRSRLHRSIPRFA